jgi:hypothetical protein
MGKRSLETIQLVQKKADATFVASSIRSPDSKSKFYKTAVKQHRKPLSKLTSYDNGYGLIKFSDGTEALV